MYVCDVLDNLAQNKATGQYEISHKMLKGCSKTVCKPLCILFNRSVTLNKYPSSWKIANVMPLFKKGDKSLLSNYRPISLISCVGKVMERVMLNIKYIHSHLNSNNLIFKTNLESSRLLDSLSTH